jgi:hypothetical protein
MKSASLLALAALAAAAPAPAPAPTAAGPPVHVPIRRRSARRAPGVERYAAAAAHIRAKYGFEHSGTKAAGKRANAAGISIIDQVRGGGCARVRPGADTHSSNTTRATSGS